MQSVSIEAPRDGTIETDGLKLHYVEWSPASCDSDDRPLLLLHGSVGNARIWDIFAREIARRGHLGRIVALDLRGHGESEWAVPSAYRCDDYVRDLETVVEQLALRPVVLVAHSMAVYHSIRFATASPDRVAAMVLIDIEAKCRDEHAGLLRSAGRKPHPIYCSLEEAIERERRVFLFATDENLRAFVASNMREVAAESSSTSKPGLIYKYDRATLADFDDYDERERLAHVRCPALVVYGKQSMLGHSDKMQEMASLIPRGSFVAIGRAGHMPQLDNAEELAEAVRAFLEHGG